MGRTIDKYQCKNHFDFIKLSSNSPVNICYGLKDFFLEFYTRVKTYAGYDNFMTSTHLQCQELNDMRAIRPVGEFSAVDVNNMMMIIIILLKF